MIEITIRDLFDLEHDADLVRILTKKESLENAITLPDEPRLNLSGPRMGVSILKGKPPIFSSKQKLKAALILIQFFSNLVTNLKYSI